MPLDSKHWKKPLTAPLRTTDGITLRTLEEAAAYAIRVEDREALRQHWQHAAGLLAQAAQYGGREDIAQATRQMELALFLSRKLALKEV